ncbi:MAG: archease [Candidatus Hadarchaeales archaeon]
MKRFEWVEHPSDVGFRAYGRDLSEAFANAGLALFEIMTETSKVQPREEVSIELRSESPTSLLYDWIDRLIALHDSTNILLSRFEVGVERGEGEWRLRARAWGEKFDPARHPSKTAVKAMTYHMMEIGEEEGRVWVQGVVDI